MAVGLCLESSPPHKETTATLVCCSAVAGVNDSINTTHTHTQTQRNPERGWEMIKKILKSNRKKLAVICVISECCQALAEEDWQRSAFSGICVREKSARDFLCVAKVSASLLWGHRVLPPSCTEPHDFWAQDVNFSDRTWIFLTEHQVSIIVTGQQVLALSQHSQLKDSIYFR